MWIWQQTKWPEFYWDQAKLNSLLDKAHLIHSSFIKQISWLNQEFALQAIAETLIEEAMQTSAIEGELLERESVRSSVARHLGLPTTDLLNNQNAEGIVALLINSAEYQSPLDNERLFAWHASLFPTGYSNMYKINIANYRQDKMYVMSGRYGNQNIHFEAPPPELIIKEMSQFLLWFNTKSNHLDGIIRSAIAHLYFITLHPFDDGNGRIARALIDLSLSQFEQSQKRFYHLSAQIEKHRNEYYTILEKTQSGDLDITSYLNWFLETFIAAILQAEKTLNKILGKAKFWQHNSLIDLNARQKKALNLLLDYGTDFIGNLNTRKYASLNKVSRATAYRELNDMFNKGCLEIINQGRSTSYTIKITHMTVD